MIPFEEPHVKPHVKLEVWKIVNKGAALDNLGRYQEAMACYDKALDIFDVGSISWWLKRILSTLTPPLDV